MSESGAFPASRRRRVVPSPRMAKRDSSSGVDQQFAANPEAFAARSPVCLLFGAQRKLILDVTAAAKRGLAERMGCPLDDVQTVMFDGGQARCAEVLDECRSLGLMSQAKAVIVDRVEAMISLAEGDESGGAPMRGRGEKTARELLLDYIKQPEPSCVLVLRGERVTPGKLKDALIAAGCLCLQADKDMIPGGLTAWIRNTAKKQYGIAITDEAVQVLEENLGGDLGRIDMELAKLSTAAASRGLKQIDETIALEFGSFSRKLDPWTIHAGIASGDVEVALNLAKNLEEISGIKGVAQLIFIADLPRKLDGLARGLANRENEMALCGRMKVWGESKVLVQYAKHFGERRTSAMLRDAYAAYSKAVSGQGDARLLAEQLIVRLTTEFAKVRAGARG